MVNFKALKQKLLLRPVVRLKNLEADFIFDTDVSLVDVEPVFKHIFKDSSLEYPVAYSSVALTKLEGEL